MPLGGRRRGYNGRSGKKSHCRTTLRQGGRGAEQHDASRRVYKRKRPQCMCIYKRTNGAETCIYKRKCPTPEPRQRAPQSRPADERGAAAAAAERPRKRGGHGAPQRGGGANGTSARSEHGATTRKEHAGAREHQHKTRPTRKRSTTPARNRAPRGATPPE